MQKSLFPVKYLWKEKACLRTVEGALTLDCAGLKTPIEKLRIKDLSTKLPFPPVRINRSDGCEVSIKRIFSSAS